MRSLERNAFSSLVRPMGSTIRRLKIVKSDSTEQRLQGARVDGGLGECKSFWGLERMIY